MYQLYALCCPRRCINHHDCRREISLPTTGTLLCFALMYAVATGANLYNLNPIDATVLGDDAGLRGLRDARRRHDPTRPLRHRDFRLLAVSTSHHVLNFAAHRFPCSTGASAPRPRPARTRTASSPCRSKRSASSDTTRACPYLLSISLARAARRGFFLLVYISVHLANTATKRAAGGEDSPIEAWAVGRRPLT